MLDSDPAWSEIRRVAHRNRRGRGDRPWYDYQRGYDYYDEMALVWLDVDTLIRERSGDRHSIDDFARAFFDVEDGRVAPLTYRFEDIVAALNGVEPYDWATMLRERLDRVGDGQHLLDALAPSGWRLESDAKESDLARNARETDDAGPMDSSYWSIGVDVGKDGRLERVRWEGPAWRAGLAPGEQIIAVNGLAYQRDGLARAIAAAGGRRAQGVAPRQGGRALSYGHYQRSRRAALSQARARRRQAGSPVDDSCAAHALSHRAPRRVAARRHAQGEVFAVWPSVPALDGSVEATGIEGAAISRFGAREWGSGALPSFQTWKEIQ